MLQTKKIQVLLVRVSNAVIKHDQKNLGSKGLFHLTPDSHYQDRNRETGTGWQNRHRGHGRVLLADLLPLYLLSLLLFLFFFPFPLFRFLFLSFFSFQNDLLIFNTILLIIWNFHTMHPDHNHFPILACPPPTLVTSHKPKEKKKEKIPTPICVSHILTGVLSNSQWSAP